MVHQHSKSLRLYLVIGSLIVCFALVLQLYLMIGNRKVSIPETTIRFFSFYTILTNILVALSFSSLLLKPGSQLGKYFFRQGVVTAIAVYIITVGIVYNLVLRQIWNPRGWDRVADELLHVGSPILFFFFWLFYSPKDQLKWKGIFLWLLYPLIYLIWILFFGALSGWYPYPFVDVNVQGYHTVLFNSAGLTIGFSLLSLFFVAIGKFMSKNKKYRNRE